MTKSKSIRSKKHNTATTTPASTTTRLFYDQVESPLGPFTVVADGTGKLVAAGWTDDATDGRMASRLNAFAKRTDVELVRASNPGGLSAAMAAYFAGDLAAIETVPLGDAAGTPFQRAVWSALRSIPCGTSWSYGELACAIDRPSAVRAVGLANGANPICIVVPCHRVIGASGKLVGYGGGIERKRWLLAHEQRAAVAAPAPARRAAAATSNA